ncbi:MAG TPA: SRPBCC family protein [Gemmataceae bacterium]|jgi:hypothetical protein|nr:SRPBCC family protein [Gemmataceae bacterium]
MPGFTLTRTYPASVADTFALFTDLANAPDRIPAIKKIELLTPGRVGLGTKFKETRVVFKREATETFEITAFDRDRHYEVVATSCGAEYRTAFAFAPDGAGTRVDVTFNVRAVSFFAKLFSPLARLMMGTIKKCVSEDMDGLGRALAPPVA